jgi:hypothetical protein
MRRAFLRRAAAPLFAAALALLSAGVPGTALAQQPPKLEPLPPPPPPPPGVNPDSEPPIEIGPGPNDKVEEFMIDGQRGMKVTTPQGRVYYLVPDSAENVGTQGPVSHGRVAKWLIKEF